MTDRALGQAFVRAGFSDDAATARAALMTVATKCFGDRFDRSPAWRWFVPGRIEVFGKHTDYAGGQSLVCAVPRGIAVAAAPRRDGRVHVVDAIDGRATTVSPDDADLADGWARYVAVTATRLASNFAGATLGADIVIANDLPRAAGLSSSSALVVAVATALIRRGQLERRAEWDRLIPTRHDLAWYLGCVENGSDYFELRGAAGVGTRGGSEDHTAILTCRADCVSQNRYIPVQPIAEVPLPNEWMFVVATSGVTANKIGNARDRYNHLSSAVAALLDVWNGTHPDGHAPTLAAALARGTSAEAELMSLVQSSGGEASERSELARRLMHFVREDGRVAAAADAIAAADHRLLGELAAESQRDADDLLGTQIPETRALTECALAAGAWAASSFGAGFGGSAWALVAAEDADQFARAWHAEYRQRCPHIRDAQSFVARPSPGLIELAADAEIRG